MNPITGANLLLRFLLELAGLFGAGYWGFAVMPTPLDWLVGIGLPLAMAAAWGVFRIPNDGGRPVVTVGGQTRLLLEAVFFAIAIGGLFHAGRGDWGAIFLALVILHYAIDYPRTLDLFFGRR